ncbi:MAG: hypothetical protein H0T46_31760 [Deltaproteobacteria bacterium]|nr:hypothetical protein [Deltaproteobacteria bacterium]
MSAPDEPDDKKPDPGDSGSVDVALSSTTIPQSESEAVPTPVGELESQPVSTGKVRTAVAGEQTNRTTRLRTATRDAIDAGVEKLGTGIGSIGAGVEKLGEKSRKVPIVGSSMTRLGEGITQMGESLHGLPRAAKTRRGRLLVRSLFVGFVLVASWITVIVALQLHGNVTPDFRPTAESILVELSKDQSAIEAAYDKASPRFHEMVNKEKFVDEMKDLRITVGTFREITAVNDSLVTSGPTGRIGRVSLTVAYERATCKASVSLHEHEGAWKLLGIGVELPKELTITQAQREERVQACKDPMAKSCDLYVAANGILHQLRDGEAAKVWDAASQVFQKQEERTRFIALQEEHRTLLGPYSRILRVTEAKVIGGSIAAFDVITEYERSSGVAVTFGFYRESRSEPWKLRSLKVVLPMPRAGDTGPVAGTHSRSAAGSGSGSGSAESAGSGSAVGSGGRGSSSTRPTPRPPRAASGSADGSGTGPGSGSGSGSSALDVVIPDPAGSGSAATP